MAPHVYSVALALFPVLNSDASLRRFPKTAPNANAVLNSEAGPKQRTQREASAGVSSHTDEGFQTFLVARKVESNSASRVSTTRFSASTAAAAASLSLGCDL